MELELTILIPTLNEADSLPPVLEQVKKAAAELTPKHEILIVDGGSSDGTARRAGEAGAKVVRQESRGFGGAVRDGLAAARGRWVLCMDADGSHPARYLRDLWERRVSADIVVASRWMEGGSADMSLWRLWLSVALNAVTRAVLDLPIKDSSSGLRLYNRAFVRALPLSATDFTIQQETIVRTLAAGGRVEEAPFHYAPRLGGVSKASVRVLAWRYLAMLARLRKVRGLGEPAAFAAVMLLAAATSLWALDWGLPGPQRHKPWGGPPTEAEARDLAERWSQLYRDIEDSHRRLAPDEAQAADPLLASRRSYLLHTENPDEKKSFIVLSRMRPWKLDFQPLYAQYGGGFIYPLGAALLAVPGKLTSDLAHYLQRPEDMGRLYLAGRMLVAAAHVATVALLFFLGRGLAGWGAGAAGAALWALCPLAVTQAHLVKPHAYATFWVVLAAMHRRGFYAGMAAASSLATAPFFLLLGRRWKQWLIAAAVFFAFNPYLFLAYKDFAWELEVYSPQRLGSPAGFAALGTEVGWGLLAVCLAGLLAGRAWAALAAGAILAARFGGSAARLFHPLIALGCAYGAALIWRLTPPGPRAVLVCSLLALGAARSLPILSSLAAGQGRPEAAAWVDAHVPAGAVIGLNYYPDPAHVPPFTFGRYELAVSKDCPRKPAPWLVVERESALPGCGPYELQASFGLFNIYKLKS